MLAVISKPILKYDIIVSRHSFRKVKCNSKAHWIDGWSDNSYETNTPHNGENSILHFKSNTLLPLAVKNAYKHTIVD